LYGLAQGKSYEKMKEGHIGDQESGVAWKGQACRFEVRLVAQEYRISLQETCVEL
jgi:hypothetical protein